MFTEAAEEYEAALKYAPDSTDLLRRTIAAHQRTGNTPREKELSAHLAKITKRLSRRRRERMTSLMYPLFLTAHCETCQVLKIFWAQGLARILVESSTGRASPASHQAAKPQRVIPE
jgi:hypothetical protein